MPFTSVEINTIDNFTQITLQHYTNATKFDKNWYKVSSWAPTKIGNSFDEVATFFFCRLGTNLAPSIII